VTLKQFEISIIYWDLHPQDWERKLHLFVDSSTKQAKKKHTQWWEARFAEHNVTLESLRASLQAAREAQLKTPPCQPWIVDLYKQVSFIPHHHRANEEPQVHKMSCAALVIWGALTDILCKGRNWPEGPEGKAWKLQLPMFRQVRQDLTEQFELPEASAAPEAAAADAVNAEPHDHPLEEQQLQLLQAEAVESDYEMPEDITADDPAAAAAAASEQRAELVVSKKRHRTAIASSGRQLRARPAAAAASAADDADDEPQDDEEEEAEHDDDYQHHITESEDSDSFSQNMNDGVSDGDDEEDPEPEAAAAAAAAGRPGPALRRARGPELSAHRHTPGASATRSHNSKPRTEKAATKPKKARR